MSLCVCMCIWCMYVWGVYIWCVCICIWYVCVCVHTCCSHVPLSTWPHVQRLVFDFSLHLSVRRGPFTEPRPCSFSPTGLAAPRMHLSLLPALGRRRTRPRPALPRCSGPELSPSYLHTLPALPPTPSPNSLVLVGSLRLRLLLQRSFMRRAD